jgi:uncharacterized membrane protein YkoI
MRGRLKGGLIAAAALVALGGGGAAIAGATGGKDDGSGTPITGSALDRAKAVALEHTRGGRVTATEVRDEEGYYEVEVKRDDGSSVDVHLDRDFNVLGGRADDDASGDQGPGDD